MYLSYATQEEADARSAAAGAALSRRYDETFPTSPWPVLAVGSEWWVEVLHTALLTEDEAALFGDQGILSPVMGSPSDRGVAVVDIVVEA